MSKALMIDGIKYRILMVTINGEKDDHQYPNNIRENAKKRLIKKRRLYKQLKKLMRKSK